MKFDIKTWITQKELTYPIFISVNGYQISCDTLDEAIDILKELKRSHESR